MIGSEPTALTTFIVHSPHLDRTYPGKSGRKSPEPLYDKGFGDFLGV